MTDKEAGRNANRNAFSHGDAGPTMRASGASRSQSIQNAEDGLVNILQLLTGLAQTVGELHSAATAFGTLESVRDGMCYPRTPIEGEEYEQIQNGLKMALGLEAYGAARTEGRGLSLEQALANLEETLKNQAL